MNGIFENALVKVAYKVSGSGQIGFKFRGKFELPAASLVAMNNEFKLYYSTGSQTDFEGRIYINTEISRGAFLSEKKFMALLSFFKDCAEIVSGTAAGRESTIENERYTKHKTHKIFMLCDALDGIKESWAVQEIERAKKAAEEKRIELDKITEVVKNCGNDNIVFCRENEKIHFQFPDLNYTDWEYYYNLPEPTTEVLNNAYFNKYEDCRLKQKFQVIEDKFFADNPKANKYWDFPTLSLNVAERIMNFVGYKRAITKATQKLVYNEMKSEGYKIQFAWE